MLLTANGSLGWRHAFSSAPNGVFDLAGAPSFSVAGTPVALTAQMGTTNRRSLLQAG